MKFYIVDAFTDKAFGGNAAGIVYAEDGELPPEYYMRSLAAELRYSETAFFTPTGTDAGGVQIIKVRYFTPADEVDLCGHATIGGYCALAKAGVIEPGRVYINDAKAGRLRVEVHEDCSVLMDMAPPAFIKALTDEEIVRLYDIMGTCGAGANVAGAAGSRELVKYFTKCAGGEDTLCAPEIISSGLPDIIMPVKDEAELDALAPDMKALSELSDELGVVGVHAFTVQASDGRIHTRNFAPLYDINEEAATGTSSGALTYYLYEHGAIRHMQETVYIQGEKMGRPSCISCRAERTEPSGSPDEDARSVRIRVGGSAVILASGELVSE